MQGTLDCFDRLDYAFNNAGFEGAVNTPIAEQTEDNYRRVFDINVLVVLLCMKHEIPAILRWGGGAIVNNASVAGRIGRPEEVSEAVVFLCSDAASFITGHDLLVDGGWTVP